MMKQEENNSATPAEIVATPSSQTGSSWYKNGGVGLVGGVVGALVAFAILPLVQDKKETPIAEQIAALSTRLEDRLEDAKTDREKEFSRVFNAIAALEDSNRKHEASFATVGRSLTQLRGDYEKGFGRVDENITQTGSRQEEQSIQLQNLAEVSASLVENLDGLKSQLAQLEAQNTISPPQTDEEQVNWLAQATVLKDQLDALEREIAILPQIMQRLDDTERTALNIVDGQNASIEGFIADMSTAFEQKAQELAQQQQAFATLAREVAALRNAPPPASDQALAMLIAANSLKAAVDRGGSYAQELQIFSPLAPADLALDGLERYASSGLPNIAALSVRFAKIADEIAATENVLPEDAGLTDQILHQGNRLYSSRPVGDVEGTSAAAIAARMEVAIGQGDFARALSEARDLPAAAKSLARDFIEIVEARQNIDALLSRLIANSLSGGE